MDTAKVLDVVLEAIKDTVTDWRELLAALDNAAIATDADKLAAYDDVYNSLYAYFIQREYDNL